MPHMYLDKFDGVCDLDTFLDLFPADKSWLLTGYLPIRVLGTKAYYDGDFKYGESYIENMRTLMKQNQKDSAETKRSYIEKVRPSYDSYLSEQYAHIDRVIADQYKCFYGFERDNDLSGVPSYVENGKRDTLDLLKMNYSKLFK